MAEAVIISLDIRGIETNTVNSQASEAMANAPAILAVPGTVIVPIGISPAAAACARGEVAGEN